VYAKGTLSSAVSAQQIVVHFEKKNGCSGRHFALFFS
jgi:hypothetical protein